MEINKVYDFLKSKGFKEKSLKTYISIINKIINKIGENFDIKDLPSPSRKMLNMKYYIKQDNIRSLITSRGCPHKCIFCYNSWRQEPLRFYPPEYIMKEIEMLTTDYGTKEFFFFDDSFLMNKPRLKKICGMMVSNKNNLKWSCQARVDTIDEHILDIIKKAGCNKLFLGIESGSQRILNVLNKNTTVKQNKKAVRLCNQFDMKVKGLFMVGNPTETEYDIRMTQDFIKNNPMDEVAVLYTTPYPSTKLWDMYADKIHNDKLEWDDLNMGEYNVNLTSLPKERVIELFCETVNISFSNIPVKRLISDTLSDPITTIKSIVRNPSKLTGLIKRI